MNIQNQNMNYYHNSNFTNDDDVDAVDFNRESMLGYIPNPDLTNPVNNEVDLEYDQEVNELLKEILDEELAPDNSQEELKDDTSANDVIDSKKEQFQDYYDDFPEQKQEPIPQWYEEMLQNKIKETKNRLAKLSDFVCYASAATRQQIIRIERDHNTPFCKLDTPRHPPFSEPWQNYWRFNCVIKCKEEPDPPPYHAHTADCELLLLEHVGTGVTTRTKNILPCEFPKHVMDTVELFQIFAKESSKVDLTNDDIPDTVFEKPTWQYIKIRSNFKGEIMLLACGKGITPALNKLKKFFYNGRGRACNVVSLYCINIKWSQKKSIFPPTFLTGCLELRDKVGPITIRYNPKTNINFNSVEVTELGKIMLEYLEPTPETTVIDVGCGIGALSLMLGQKSDKVLGLSALDHEIKSAEEMKNLNGIHNVSFILCTPREVQTKLAPWVKKCISVAVVNLNTPFGKAKEATEVMNALRELPTIWRIAVYGSFSFENRKCIEKLTYSANDSEFLPMRGCILDKSPTIQNLFDIVILFERKSLIEPKIELIASGPTVNVKSDTFNSGSFIENRFKTDIKEEINATRFPGPKPFLKGGRPSRKFGRFDSPMLPIEKDIKPKLPLPPKEILDFTVPPPPPPVSDEPSFSSLSESGASKDENQPYPSKSKVHRPSVIDMLNVKALKRKFDSPSLPINPPKTAISVNGSQQSTNLANGNLNEMHDSSTNTTTSYPPWHKPTEIQSYPQQMRQTQSFADSGLLRVKQEHELKCSSQVESLNEPVNPMIKCEKNAYFENTAVKKEPRFDFSPLSLEEGEDKTSDSAEQKPSFEKRSSSREEGELSDSGDNSVFLDAIIKPEPMDLDDDDDESGLSSMVESQVKNETLVNNAVSSPTYIKTEPIDFNEFSIKPIKSEVSDISEDLESIKSSISDSNKLFVKPDPETTNFKQLQADPEVQSQFFWHENFLRVKPELGSASFSTVNVKSEPIESDIQTLEEVSENISSDRVTVKSENVTSLPDIDDIENMVTPVRNPAILARQYSPSPPPSASTYDGFEFSVKPNMSFLSLARESTSQSVKVKQERVEPESNKNVKNHEDDVEIEIIGMKGGETSDVTSKKSIKIESENSANDTNGDDKQSDDLRKLLEQRQKLQKQLEGNLDSEKPKRRFNLSPSRTRRSTYSPSEWRPRSRYSPDTVRRRRDLSPESTRWGRRPRSPSFDRYREGKPPDRRPYKRNRSPDSPNGFWRKKRQSPGPFDSPVYRRNRSPDGRPMAYGRKNRSSESPDRPWSRNYRSSESPDKPPFRKNRSPCSPDKPWLKKKSPPSFERNWRYRNKSPPISSKNNWDKKYKTRSPSRINSRSKSRSSSPSERRRRRSPLSLSPNPPAKHLKPNKSPVDEHPARASSPTASLSSKISLDEKFSDSKKKKKKKKKKSSKSKSPHRSESEKKEKKKRRSSKSVEPSVGLQLDAVSADDSPGKLEAPATVELPNEIPVPTAVV